MLEQITNDQECDSLKYCETCDEEYSLPENISDCLICGEELEDI